MNLQPRRWWAGALDVERLAWTSVTDAVRSAQAVADARSIPVTVETEPGLVATSFAAIEHLRIDGREPAGWAPLSGFFATGDGWVRLHANYPHHAAAISRATGASTRDDLTRRLAGMSAVEVETAVADERGIAAAVRTAAEWATHPHGAATADEPWTQVEVCGERRPLPAGADGVLAGVRVLDLTRVIAGPTCSQLLACLGADVLRIDPPGRPELLDHYLSNAMGKRSSALDLSTASALEGLLDQADVVLLGYRPGSLTRFGLDPSDLVARSPHLVVGSLSAWGEQVGPWSDRPGFDSIVQAASGIAAVTGSEQRPGACRCRRSITRRATAWLRT